MKLTRKKRRLVLNGLFLLFIGSLVVSVMIIKHFSPKTEENRVSNETQLSSKQEKKVEEKEEEKEEVVLEPMSTALNGLQIKENPVANFEGTAGKFVLRSTGDVLVHETVSHSADTTTDIYKNAVSALENEGIHLEKLKSTYGEFAKPKTETYDFSPMFAQIAPFTEYADATIANLEVIAAYPDFPISGYPQFNMPSAVLTNLKNSGIDIVSNGSNHSLDYFSEGALASIKYIKEAGLLYSGSYESQEDQKTARVIDKNGIKVGFLTYSYGTNGIPVDQGKEFTISLIEMDRMLAEVKALNEKVDAVVVTLHVGQEYDPLPDDNQTFIYEMLSEAGAKVILGTHPHVLQPVEWLNNHQTYVIYSQASFLSGQIYDANKQGGITEITFERQADGKVIVNKPKFMPIYIRGQEGTMYDVVPYADYQKYAIPNGEADWATIKQKMTTFTTDFEYVTHLETAHTKEGNNQFR